jgi:DNA-binding NarL/FixJ family response regulator
MILLLSDDLIDASKSTASGRAAGVVVRQMRTVAALLEQALREPPTCCVVDLAFPGLDIAGLAADLTRDGKKVRLIAYGSHVDTTRLGAARQAGYEHVLPRSAYFETMPAQIAEWDKPL